MGVCIRRPCWSGPEERAIESLFSSKTAFEKTTRFKAVVGLDLLPGRGNGHDKDCGGGAGVER
jgi:hypothetical protein